MAHHILLIEDDPTDAELAKHYLQKLAPDLLVTHFTEGRAFLAYCLGESAVGVSIAIIDLHMRDLGGIDILAALREENQRLPFPILILSSSNHPEEISRAYELGASGFITKPVLADEYRKALEHILNFWLSTNRVA